MKICEKHQTKISANDELEQVVVISIFNEKMDVLSVQESIEYKRKNTCQVCFFGAEGRKMLDSIIESQLKVQAKKILV